jgi:hypothetical protein
MSKTRVIDLSKIIKIRKFDNAVVFYEQDTYHVCEPNTELRKECEEHEEFTKKAKFIFNRFARGDCEEAEKKLKELQE